MKHPFLCDHKFVDSTRCLKCGWESMSTEKRKIKPRICVYCEQTFAMTTQEIREHAEDCKDAPVVKARAQAWREANTQRKFGVSR